MVMVVVMVILRVDGDVVRGEGDRNDDGDLAMRGD